MIVFEIFLGMILGFMLVVILFIDDFVVIVFIIGNEGFEIFFIYIYVDVWKGGLIFEFCLFFIIIFVLVLVLLVIINCCVGKKKEV